MISVRLGALITSHDIIGVKQTPVRAVIERVADFIPRPRLYFNLVVKSEGICGLYIGDPRASWPAAAGLSAQVHIRYVERPYRQVLSVMPGMYDDMWTAAKGMYKLVVTHHARTIFNQFSIKKASTNYERQNRNSRPGRHGA